MKSSYSPLAVLFLLFVIGGLISCDRKSDDVNRVEDRDSSPRATKAHRSGRDELLSNRKNFEAELRAAEQLSDPAERDRAIADLARQALESRPELAQLAILKLSADSPELLGLLNDCLGTMLASGADSVIAWAATIEDERMAGIVRESLAEIIPDEEIRSTVALALDRGRIAGTGFRPGDERMLQRWAGLEPKAAAAWLANLPMGEARNEGFRNVSRSLAQAGDATAANWLKAIESPELKAKAKEAIVETLLQTPEPIRDALLGPPESELRFELGEALARLKPPVEPPPVPEQPADEPATNDQIEPIEPIDPADGSEAPHDEPSPEAGEAQQ